MKDKVIISIALVNLISMVLLMLSIDSFTSWKPFAVLFMNIAVLCLISIANWELILGAEFFDEGQEEHRWQ